MYQVTIDGNNVDGLTVPGSTTLRSTLGARTIGGLTIHQSGTWRPYKGDEVYFYDTDRAQTAFGGIVYRAKKRIIPGSDIMEWTLKFTDFSALADQARVLKAYSDTTRDAIVQDLITNYLAQFGVTAGVIATGGAVTKKKYNGQSAAEVLNELADEEGYIWYIDHQKKLHFIAKESYVAPFAITDDNPDYKELHIEESLDDFCNAIYYRGSANGITDERTETMVGDGTRTEFKVRFKLLEEPTIKVNDVEKTVGIWGVESGCDWYWNEGDKIVRQDAAGTVLTASDTLSITYVGTFGIMVLLEDKASIAEHGRYEAFVEDSSVPYLDAAINAAETKLKQNPYDKVDAKIITYAAGLRAGMVLSLAQSEYGIDTQILITSVEAEEREDVDLSLKYTVEGVTGERREDWIEFYRMMTRRAAYEERDDETITQCGKVEATVEMSHAFSVISRPQAVFGDGAGSGSTFDGGAAFW